MGQSPNKIARLGGLRRSSEPQEAFVKDNETVEAEALEDAGAGVTVTVAVPLESVTEWEATSELDEAIELDTATELVTTSILESVTELEAARERTMT